MGFQPSRQDPRDWHGHRIVTEVDLGMNFPAEDPKHSDRHVRRMRRLRHGIVLALLAMLMVAAVVAAYMVMTRQLVIPGWEPEPEPTIQQPAADEPACPVEVLTPPAPGDVTVNVLNGTQIPKLATTSAKDLEERGFVVGEVGNATLSNTGIVAAVVSGPAGRAQALALQRQIADTEYVADPQRTDAVVDLVLGKDYKGLVEVDAVDADPGTLSCPRVEGG